MEDEVGNGRPTDGATAGNAHQWAPRVSSATNRSASAPAVTAGPLATQRASQPVPQRHREQGAGASSAMWEVGRN